MPVVINEFEVIPEAPPDQRKRGGEAGGDAPPPAAVDPCAVASALRTLDVQALRVWAH